MSLQPSKGTASQPKYLLLQQERNYWFNQGKLYAIKELDKQLKEVKEKAVRVERERIIKIGNRIINSCQRARDLAKNGNYDELSSWNEKGIGILDDDSEFISAEGFWKYLLNQLQKQERSVIGGNKPNATDLDITLVVKNDLVNEKGLGSEKP